MKEDLITYWEGIGYETARQDPQNWEKNITGYAEAKKSQNQPEIVKKAAEGKICQQRGEELTSHLNAGGGAPTAQAVQGKLGGSFFLIFIACIFFLVSVPTQIWTLKPFQLHFIITYGAALIVALACIVFFKLGMEKFDLIFPQEEMHALILYLSFIGIALALAAVFGFSYLRALQAQVTGDQVGNFYKTGSKILGLSLFLVTVIGELAGALAFYTGYTGLAAALPIYRMGRELNRTNQRIEQLGTEITFFREEPNIILQAASIGARKAIAELQNRKPESEFRRKIIKGLIFVALIMLLVFIILAKAMAAETTVGLLDLTASSEAKDYSGKNSFDLNKKAVTAFIQGIKPGQSFHLVGVTESSFTRPFIIFQARAKTEPGYFKEIIAQERKRILEEWAKTSKELKPESKKSDYLGAIRLAEDLLNNKHGTEQRSLFIFGDMLLCTEQLDLEKAGKIDEKFIREALSRIHIPDLKGVTVRIYGAGGRDEGHYDGIERFWTAYFQAAGAKLETYSKLREVQNE